MKKLKISHLEWHVAHACNLTCEGCAHFSNHGHKGIINYETLKKWYGNWSHRLAPRTIDILGGEPLLNKDIYNIIRLTREMWDDPNLECLNLQTNGFLLHKYPELPKVLKETNCRLTLSRHGNSPSYNAEFDPAEKLITRWKEEYDIETCVADCYTYWLEMYKGYGNNMMPFEDNDPQKSWDNCVTGQDCFQLLDNNIYKCAPLAYLPYQKEKYNLSSKWDHYLTYKPLTPQCSDFELKEFFDRKCESFCAMCPSNPKLFKNKDPMIPRSEYEKINIKPINH